MRRSLGSLATINLRLIAVETSAVMGQSGKNGASAWETAPIRRHGGEGTQVITASRLMFTELSLRTSAGDIQEEVAVK